MPKFKVGDILILCDERFSLKRLRTVTEVSASRNSPHQPYYILDKVTGPYFEDELRLATELERVLYAEV